MTIARPRPRNMTRRRAAWLAVAWLGAIAAPIAKAEPDCAAEVGGRVQRRYEKVRDLHAHFEQRTERVALGSAPGAALVASGDAVFAKPGKMRWTYVAPEPSLVVSDGTTLWIYDEKAKEVQKLALAAGYLSAAGVQFLLGEGKLADEFQISAQHCGEPTVTLVLVPKQDAQYERLELRVDAKSGAVAETAVVDLFGNRTVVAFQNARENAGADAAAFRFSPPAGVRVVEVPAAAP
jgi:outer membrane lipoprotein carrier protein